MNFELKKIKWEPGKAATQLQLMTLRVRRKSDEDEAINYTLIADEMQVYTDGTILNPPVIKNLEEDTTYVFRISNNDPAGGQFDMVYTTPREMETAEITKAYYHNSELICNNSTGFLDATLPPKIGGYYGLEYSLADWFGYNPNITLVGGPVWKKAKDLIGISFTASADRIQAPTSLALERDVKTKYSLGLHFYVNAEDLPATGIWPLVSFGAAPGGNGILLYVNCDTKKVHWRHQNGEVIEEIVSATTINTGQWNKILVFRAADITASKMWLNSFNTFTGALTDAGVPTLNRIGTPLNVGTMGGIFSKFYYNSLLVLDDNVAGKYMEPPYPVGILENPDNPEDKYSIYRKNMIVINNSRIVCTIPPDAPTGYRLFYIQNSSGVTAPVGISILPFDKVAYPLELDFSTDNGVAESQLKSNFYAMAKSWGGANGGVSPQNIYMQDGLLVMEAHGDLYDGNVQGYAKNGTLKLHDNPEDPLYNAPWTTRVGAVIASKEYCGYGSYVVEAKLPREMGVAPAFWTFHYGEVYPQDPRYEQLLAQGLHRQGSFADGYYVVENNEIDMELPSHNANHVFATVAEMLSPNYHINWGGEKVAVESDPDPANNGTWQLNNVAQPNVLSSWTKLNNEVQHLHQPRTNNIKCNNWKGELGSGKGFTFGTDPFNDEYLSMLTSIGKDVWDDEFHEFRFDWYADRVEFYVDGQQIQVNRHFVPDIPGRWTIGLWFPSQPNPERPWQVNPTGAWAGPAASWRYQKMTIRKILHTPFIDEDANGTNRMVGETYPFDGFKSFPLPQP